MNQLWAIIDLLKMLYYSTPICTELIVQEYHGINKNGLRRIIAFIIDVNNQTFYGLSLNKVNYFRALRTIIGNIADVSFQRLLVLHVDVTNDFRLERTLA